MNSSAARPRTTRVRARRANLARAGYAAAAGLLSGAVAVAAGQLAAAALRPSASPIIAIGNAAIGRAPEAVRSFAIRNFGTDDKTVLVTGVLLVLALACTLIGLLGLVSRVAAAIGVLILGTAGMLAAGTNAGALWSDMLPSVATALVGVAVLSALLGRVPRPAAATATRQDAARAGAAHRAPDRRRRHDRRQFLAASASTAVVATAGVVGARAIEGARFDANRSRAGIRLPKPVETAPPPSAPPSTPRPTSPPPARSASPSPSVSRPARTSTPPAPSRPSRSARSATPSRSPARSRPSAPPSRSAARRPGPSFDVNGLSAFRTPNDDFYRVDTSITVPQLDPKTWSLRIHGMVSSPRTISYQDLIARGLIEREITLCCVSNEVGGPYISTASFLGAPLAPLLAEVGVDPAADQILTRSSDGWTCGTPTATATDGRDAMLAVGMNGVPLPVEHGFPVRMVVPGLYGYVSGTKWIVDMELTTFAAYDAYWVRRGWSPPGPIVTESRVDTPRLGKLLTAGPVPVAGVAWAQHRGIGRVQVRVDGGSWHEADLGPIPSTDTWRQWVWTWNARPGSHVLQVRATDGAGTVQTPREMSAIPSGATGWHSVSVQVVV